MLREINNSYVYCLADWNPPGQTLCRHQSQLRPGLVLSRLTGSHLLRPTDPDGAGPRLLEAVEVVGVELAVALGVAGRVLVKPLSPQAERGLSWEMRGQ